MKGFKLNLEKGQRQGYRRPEEMIRAANRAMRWLRKPRNRGMKPPRHIAAKMLLIEVMENGATKKA